MFEPWTFRSWNTLLSNEPSLFDVIYEWSLLGKIFSFRIILQALPTIVFTAITISALISDYALASLLSLLLKHGQFGISFEGMEQGINLGDLFGEVETGKRTIASLKLKGELNNFFIHFSL